MIWLVGLIVVIIIGIALYPIPGMIVFDKIHFAIIDDEKEKASRLFKRYKWLLSKEDKEILNHKLIKLIFQTEENITKENNGNS